MRKLLLALAAITALDVIAGTAQQQPSTVSNMPFASVPFNGSELLYVVQSGVSKKTTIGAVQGIASGGIVTTVAGLVTAFPSPTAGQAAFVTDAASCVFGAGLTGNAAGVPGCPVHWNGSKWTAG